MSSSRVFSNRIDILRNISKTAMGRNTNVIELANSTLQVIGQNLGTVFCAIFEVSRPDNFRFASGHKMENPSEANCLLKLIRPELERALEHRQICSIHIEASIMGYLIPLISDKAYGVLILGFKNALDMPALELLESIGTILSTAIERYNLQQKISHQYFSTVKSLVVAIEAKDLYTQGHSQRVADYSKIIGYHMKLGDAAVKELEVTGLVHDIGKIGVKDQVLTKPDKLTDLEFESIRQHPVIGSRILEPLSVSHNIMQGTLLHHKRFDLKGYPEKADIDKLPLVPAIIGVADAFDAMTSERSYKKTMTKQEAVLELKRFRGSQFHPEIVDIMEELVSYNKI